MGFVHASLLAGLAALVLPVLIHLLFRRKARPVDLGTLSFLKIAVHKDARRRKLKQWLLLALRASCVALLVLLFARPYQAQSRGDGGTAGVAIVLIDRSASMGRERDGARLIDHAIRQLPEVLANVPANVPVRAAWFDVRVEAIEPSESAGGLLAGLEPPTALTGGTDYAAALTWAAERCEAARGKGPVSVTIITDLQGSGFGSLDGFNFPKDVPVSVVDVGPGAIANVAVTDVRPASLLMPANRPATVQATILNAQAVSLDREAVRLRLTNENKVINIAAVVSAGPGASATVRFETPPLHPGLWQGTVSVAVKDALPRDNSRHVAVYVAEKPRVLLVDGASRDVAVAGEAYFLEAALRLAASDDSDADGPFRVVVLPYAGDVQLPELGQVDVLILANVGDIRAADAAKIRAFLDRGGGTVVFGGNNLGTGSNPGYAAAGLKVGEVTGTTPARDVPFRITEFESGHPVLAPFADPQNGDLRRLTFSGCTGIRPSAGTRALARFQDGAPLLLEQHESAKRVFWWASSAGREHGEWSRTRLFLPVVHQLVRAVAGVSGTGPVHDLPAAGEEPGVRPSGAYWEVRNLEPQESELDSCTSEEFARRLGITLGTAPQSATAMEATDESRAGEYWPWFWLALVMCWMLEGLLVNRTVA
jgi:hypothetical protein